MNQNNLIDDRLNEFRQSGDEIALVLRDGTVVRGKLADFDNYVAVVDGGGQSVVYRHSILKVSAATAVDSKPVPATSPRPRQDRPKPAPRKPRPPKRPSQQTAKSQPEQPAEELTNPMADQMLKWLKSQKGGG